MADFDVLVIGGGTANNVAAAAAEAGLQTALVEPGPLGGTCLNRGCNPSKMLIQAVDAANDVRDADRFHVEATLEGVDWERVVDEMDTLLGGIATDMADDYRERDTLTLFEERTAFVDDRTVELDGQPVTGDRVVVATGSRPVVPPIDGLAEVDYLTSREALYLREPPESLVILGGGYIAVELGYVFESLGTAVTIIEKHETLVSREDTEIAQTLTEVARERHEVHTGHRVTAVDAVGAGHRVHAETETGDSLTVEAEEVLVALGRQPNTDELGLETTDIETDDRGFIETDEYLETTAENVWAQGDVAGNAMFKHAGDHETRHVIDTAVHGDQRALDLDVLPHTIFSHPQIAGVGATEDDLRESDRNYVVGRARYADSAMGRARKLEDGFVKVLAAPDGTPLGCHVIGDGASMLIHEAVLAMQTGTAVETVADTIHVHPTLGRVVESAFRDATRLL